MNRQKTLLSIVICLILLITLQQANSQTPTMQIAAGLDGGELEYINLVKQYPEWLFTQDWGGVGGRITSNYQFEGWDGNIFNFMPNHLPLATDDSYYPHHVPIMASNGYYIRPQLWFNLAVNGTHTVLAEGKGTLSIAQYSPDHFTSEQFEYSFTNGITFTFTTTGLTVPDNSGYPATTGSGPGGMGTTSMWLEITESDSLNPVRNLRILPPDYTDSKGTVHHFADEYQTHIFHPKLIEDMQKYTVIRFMDLCRTNNSNVKHWTETRQPNELGSGSIPYIDMITLGNEANRDIWLNIPHLASNGFVDTLANLIKENLNLGLKAYIEYSNEVWNGIFRQAGYAIQQGMIFGWSDNPGAKYYVRRSSEIFNRFEKHFAAERNRVMFVCAWQMGSVNEALGDYYNDQLINQTGTKPDAFAVAPYFYKLYSQSDIGVIGKCLWHNCDSCVATNVPSVQEILNDMTHSIRTDVTNGLRYSRIGADKYHIPLINYEGGPHAVGIYGAENSCELTDHLAKTNRSPEMYKVYQEWMDTVQASGVKMLNQFVDRSGWSKWGCWGMEEYRGQDNASPKFRALVDWENTHPIILDTQAPSAPGTPVKSASTSTLIAVSWDPSTDNGMIIGYDLFLNGTFCGSSTCQENNLGYTIRGLKPNTTYNLSVKARDFGGNYSPMSNILTASTDVADTIKPTTVINLTLIKKTSNEIKLHWSPSTDNDRVEKYIIDWGTAKDSTEELSYQIKNLVPEQTYTVYVYAKDPSGNVSSNSYITVTTDIYPALKAHKATKAVNIDGALNESEWKMDIEVDKLISYASVPDDDTILIGVLWDSHYLYIGAKAMDSKLQKGYDFWYGDGFEFLVDGNNNRSATLETGHDVKYTIQWNNPALYGDDISGVLHNYTDSNGGWSCEIAIPWAKLGITSPKEGMDMGFDIIYDDCDNSTWDRERQYTIIGDESIYSSCEQFANLNLSSDNIPPTAPVNIVVSNITMGSAIISWNPSTDETGILGYNIFLDDIKVNSDLVTSNHFVIGGLNANTDYTVAVVAVDKSFLTSSSEHVEFTTTGGNAIVHFDTKANTTANYGNARTVHRSAGLAVIPFSDHPDSLLFGEVAGFDKQYEIVGGYQYEYAATSAENNNFPVIYRVSDEQWVDGSLFVFTGESVASNFTGILLWSKEKFLNGNDLFNNIAFDSTSDSRIVIKVEAEDHGRIRIVIKANDSYFLSESVFYIHGDASGYNEFELTNFGDNGNINKRWTLFDPTSLTMPAGNTMNFSATDLSKVQEVGFLFSVGRENWAYSFGLIEFSAFAIQKVTDTEAPSTPEGLNATNITQSSCTINWNASTDNVGVTGYYIYMVASDGSDLLIGSSQTTYFDIKKLNPLPFYQFRVQSVDKTGNESELSNSIGINLMQFDDVNVGKRGLLKIYPNPAKERVIVDFSAIHSSSPITVKVNDLTGRVLYTQTVDRGKTQISFPSSQFYSGLYLVTIESNNFRLIEKLVVE
jgi:chitodextrinase